MPWNVLLRILCVACCLGFGLFVFANDETKSDKKILELQTQKVSLLEDIVSRYRFGFSSGKPVLEELLSAEHQLLHAKLDIAESETDRVELQEQIVENRDSLVEARRAGMRLGKNAEVDLLSARVMLLDSQIDLANEKSNGLPAQ